ncbi:2-nitropropane dioxygenase [Bradyrhizobium sp. UNPF46]|uniref:NAD(P)H-dependent flavin oxidoreductase n=1 Tax=Bradyrhizobium sp. UNPF46 TaxID=1141168 RepID=UPI001151F2F8|nr:nitronate monooxygenase family protein [Bradyrhizobium sp. UNPF46]TQF27582.1 2-nitropropane dioxygenase [Bradyrhizobium sp. UNPF46]
MAVPKQLEGKLSLPVIVAPMFLVSGPDLVVGCCINGILGTFPSLNLRTAAAFEDWLEQITSRLAEHDRGYPERPSAPYGVNIIAHRTNTRLEEDMALVVKHRVPLIITSVGNPRDIVEQVHSYGGLVFHDVTTVDWAKRAIDVGVDGIIPVCAGAGGHAGLMNPFAIVPQIREFWDGAIALSGCISDGRSVYAAQALGADFGYVGTRFIATHESLAGKPYKDMLIDCDARDLVYTPAFSGIPANMLRPSIVSNGMDPDRLPKKDHIDLGEEFNHEAKAWRDIWTAGQGVGSIHDCVAVADLVDRMKREYQLAAEPLRPREKAIA